MFEREDYYGARIVAKAIDIDCVTVTEDPFSLLSHAQLVLRASTVPLVVETNTGKIGLSLHGNVVFPQLVRLDRKDKVYGLEPLPRGPYYNSEIPAEYTWFRDRVIESTRTSEDNVTTSEPVSVAAVIWTHAHQLDQSRTVLTIGGLLLEPIQDVINGVLPPIYRRFGVFECARWEVPSSSLPLHQALFSISEHGFGSAVQTHSPFNFDTAMCLEKLTIV